MSKLITNIQTVTPKQKPFYDPEIDDVLSKIGPLSWMLWGSRYYGDATDKSDYDLVFFEDDRRPFARHWPELVSYDASDEQFMLTRHLFQRKPKNKDEAKVDMFVYPRCVKDIVLRMMEDGRTLTKIERKTTRAWNNLLTTKTLPNLQALSPSPTYQRLINGSSPNYVLTTTNNTSFMSVTTKQASTEK